VQAIYFAKRLVYSVVLIMAALCKRCTLEEGRNANSPKDLVFPFLLTVESYHDGIVGMLLESNIDPNTA
jgi:hypothetical protein